MPSTRGKLVENSTSLGCTEKFVTICCTDSGPDMKKEAK